MRLTALPVLLLALPIWACGDSTNSVGRPKVTINSPQGDATVFSQKPVTFSVSAFGRNALTSVELVAGSYSLKKCPGNNTTEIDCSVDFVPTDVAAQVQNGNLVLTANAVDVKQQTGTGSIGITVSPLAISFVQPMASGSPPAAVVKGTSALELQVDTEAVATQVQVVDGNGVPVRTFSQPPYEDNIEWAAILGPGDKVLKATVSDTEHHTASAQINVHVQCENDGECMAVQSKLRCCTGNGACYDPSTPMACQ